jgi:hypothetical protein
LRYKTHVHVHYKRAKMNVKYSVILFSALLVSCEAAQVSQPSSSVSDIDPALLDGFEGEEDWISKMVIFNSGPSALKENMDLLLNHLFYLVKHDKKIEVQDESNFHNLIQIIKERQGVLQRSRQEAKQHVTKLQSKRHLPPIWAMMKDRKTRKEESIKKMDMDILKMERILKYCSDPKNPCYQVKSEASREETNLAKVPAAWNPKQTKK